MGSGTKVIISLILGVAIGGAYSLLTEFDVTTFAMFSAIAFVVLLILSFVLFKKKSVGRGPDKFDKRKEKILRLKQTGVIGEKTYKAEWQDAQREQQKSVLGR